jgi:ACS family tartrate transporter-like MFS transporter
MATPEADPTTDAEVAKSAIHKATWRLIPLIGLGYAIAYIDRVNISFAQLQMNRDLHFSDLIYGFGAGVFFISYAACEIPSNLLLYRFGARRWLSRIMFTWGLVALAMVLVRTPIQFYIVRFLLGIAEAGFFPGIVYYLWQWFPPELRARTISRFYISYPLSFVFMGAVAGALLGLNGKLGLAGWQWLFMVEAIPAILLSFVFLSQLPDSPRDAKWLTEPERDYLIRRIEEDASVGGHSHDILSALRDPRVWLIGAFGLCMQFTMYSYNFSQPKIIKSLTGYSDTVVGFLVAGMSLLGAVAMLWNAVSSDRKKEHYLHVAVPFGLILLGFLGSGCSSLIAVAIPSLALVVIGNSAIQSPYLSIPPTFLKGKSAAAGMAAINMVGIIGGFLGPTWMGFLRDRTHSDQPGLLSQVLPSALAIAVMLYMRARATAVPTGNP